VTRAGFAARGALIGTMSGTVAGLVDQLIRTLDPVLAASHTALFAVVVYWSLAWTLPGLLLGLVLGKSIRWTDALLCGVAFVTVVGGYVNLRWLPALLDVSSLAFDGSLIAVVGTLVVLAARSPRRYDVRPRIATMILMGVLIGTGLTSTRAQLTVAPPRLDTVATGPDVLVVLLDALRADHCSGYGYARDTTPVLDRLASDGVLFEQVYSVSSWTKPVVATLFSGLYPARHLNNAINARMPDALVTLPEIYATAGYRTGVFAENNFVSPLFGYDQGVEHFEGSDPAVYTQTILGHLLGQVAVRFRAIMPVVEAARVLDGLDPGQRSFAEDGIDLPDRVLDWVGGLDDSDHFFGYVHLLKPHAPYVVPPEFDGLYAGPGSGDATRPPYVEGIGPFARTATQDPEWVSRLVDNYDQRIRFGDHQLGQIVDGIRAQGRNPLVVVLSDHGEEFGENGLFDHGHSLQEGVVRVPLVVTWPGRIPASIRVAPVNRLLDLPPSLLAWSGLDIPDQFDGEPFADLEALAGMDRTVLLEVEHGPGYGARGLVRDGLKLVVSEHGASRAEELFELGPDPVEQNSIAVPGEDPLVWMLEELQDTSDALSGRAMISEQTGIDPSTRERLRALGYVR
jgi:arylsulfatase A-like enzyme